MGQPVWADGAVMTRRHSGVDGENPKSGSAKAGLLSELPGEEAVGTGSDGEQGPAADPGVPFRLALGAGAVPVSQALPG